MRPETRIRAARILIPAAVVIGVAAAVAGVWWTVVAMGLLIATQLMNVRASHRKSDGQPPRRSPR
jgi:hypothetical protein